MGSAESKVAAQPPLAIVVSPGTSDHSQRPVVLCNFLRKQNKTVPVPAAASAQPTPPSSPTIEAVKEAKKPSAASTSDTSAASGGGPTAQLLLTNRALSLHQLGFDELSTQLLKAVKNGDQKLVERIIEISTTKQLSIINIRGMWESTPLIYACQYCHEPIALWLLQAGANVHLVNEKGVTALLLASLEGMTAVVQQMLVQLTDTTGSDEERVPIDAQVGVVYNSMADLNVRVSPLLGASMNGHVEVVRMLLQQGANVNSGVSTTGAKPAPTSSGGARGGGEGGNGALQFPLLVAAKYGHSAVVQQLIKHGARIPETDGNDNHALLLACEAAKEDCALTLLRLLPVAEHAAWKRPNCHGFTALHFCAVHGLVKAAECMLRQLQWKDDPEFLNATSSTRHECAVLMASRKKQVEMVKLLIQCDADATLADRGATSALDVLKREKRDDVVLVWQEQQQLRKKEAVSEQDRERKTVESKEVSSAQEASVNVIGVPGQRKIPVELIPVELGLDEKSERETEELRPDADRASVPASDERSTESPLTETIPQSQDSSTAGSTPAMQDAESSESSSSTAAATVQPMTGNVVRQTTESPLTLSSSPVDDVSNDSISVEQGAITQSDVPAIAALVETTTAANRAEPATLLAPQRPSSSKPRSAANKKTHNRRGTGHISQDVPSIKRLSSRAGTMSAITMGGEDDEDGDDIDEPSEVPSKSDTAAVPTVTSALPWEDAPPLLNGAASGTLGTLGSLPIEPKPSDRTASSRVMTFSRDLAPVVTVPMVENDVSRGVTAVDEPQSPSTTASSPSPRKEREKHKKKKRHSRKKVVEGEAATLTKDESLVASPSSTSKEQPSEEVNQQRFASVRIPQHDEDNNGALDDDF